MSGLTAVGDDLSQLLVGLAHDGELTVVRLPSLRDVMARPYTAGLAAEGFVRDERHVRDGWTAASLSAARSRPSRPSDSRSQRPLNSSTCSGTAWV